MFQSLFHAGTFSVEHVITTMVIALISGILIALVYRMHNTPSGKYAIVLAVIPVVTASVIMIINGNIGTSVAVAASFGLVRFRSAAGTAAEIGYLFVALAAGLTAGMGFVLLTIVLTLFVGAVLTILEFVGFGDPALNEKQLRITIPESLNYTGLFDDLFHTYTRFARLERVRTTNMGTMYELSYRLQLKRGDVEKPLIDALRCRNGNLDIMLGTVQHERNEM
ncbi:MAG: DUF4956 domain-containing protein [Lachnospiraceae bacterium]|nr:DUF4956 domain-containing protein [Lachnospiraceae bacterium]